MSTLHPDAELIALCAEFQTQEAELDRINLEIGDMPVRERDAHPLRQIVRDGVDRIYELRELIAERSACSPEGLRAKAHVILVEFRGEDNMALAGQYDPRTAMALSFARDVLGRAGA